MINEVWIHGLISDEVTVSVRGAGRMGALSEHQTPLSHLPGSDQQGLLHLLPLLQLPLLQPGVSGQRGPQGQRVLGVPLQVRHHPE